MRNLPYDTVKLCSTEHDIALGLNVHNNITI